MKRIIFALLHSEGHYVLSRNFRLQRVGDIHWVLQNYEIGRVSLGIDELMIIDVSRTGSDRTVFHRHVKRLVEECFIPVTVGGQLRCRDDVAMCFANGADKVLMNRPFLSNPNLCEEVAMTYGSQALIAGIDVRSVTRAPHEEKHQPFIGRDKLADHVRRVVSAGAGEVLIQSVERDGTGNGLDLSLARLAQSGPTPLILMGGVGQASHLSEGLVDGAVDAVATANLLNFIGDTLVRSRVSAQAEGVSLAAWSPERREALRGALRTGYLSI